MGSEAPKEGDGAAAKRARAVVVPFAVPEGCRDLGLGLAALVHAFARIDGQNVALAQLLTRDGAGSELRPIEAFVSPSTWRDLAGQGSPQDDVSLVVTGQLEPPSDGRGAVRLVVFEAKSGRIRGEVEAGLDEETAGKDVVAALESLCSDVASELGLVRDVADLPWEALESVLRAERCVLHNPLRGGPHDRLAALVHLGRAVSDAPSARFPAGRLAAVALDTVLAKPDDARIARAAIRAVERALDDSPDQPELLEALAALHVRSGSPSLAEEHVRRALATDPSRARLYALLSETRRAQGDFAGAEHAVREGLDVAPDDPLLVTERGMVALERGDVAVARADFSEVLVRSPGYPPAFLNLLGCAAKASDAGLVERLAFEAAELPDLPPEVARRVLLLFAQTQPDSGESARWAGSGPLSSTEERATCMVRLASRIVESGTDAWAELTLARAKVGLGELEAARAHLVNVESFAPESALAAEARRARFALDKPRAARELESVVRALHTVEKRDLAAVTERAKTLADDNDVWTAHFALGVAERRRERWKEARAALETAVSRCPGATQAHLELVAVHVALGSAEKALEHADRACALEGETARTLAVRATALAAALRHADARDAIDRALALDGADDTHRALAERIRADAAPPSAFAKLRQVFGFRKK